MPTVAKVLRYTGFGATVLIGVLGGMFVVGETLTYPGGVTGALLSAAWTLPMVALAVYAVARPVPAATVLTVVAFAVAAFVAFDDAVGIVPRDDVGPVGAIAVFAIGVVLGFLGLRRPARAGWLLVFVAAANIAGVVGRTLESEPGTIRHAFGGSSGAAAVPILVLGGVFLLAAWAEPRGVRGLRGTPGTLTTAKERHDDTREIESVQKGPRQDLGS